MAMNKLSISLLNADFSSLENQIKAVESEGADFLHLDVMDGHFVPNLTFGPPIIRTIRNITKMKMDAHLMINNAESCIEQYAEAGVQHISVQYEAVTHLDLLVKRIKNLGCSVGIALNPATPINVLEQILPEIDLVLIMTVNPGLGGQPLIPYCIEKIRKMHNLIHAVKKNIQLQVDGGIKLENLVSVLEAGADNVVVGTAIFSGGIKENCRAFKKSIFKHQAV